MLGQGISHVWMGLHALITYLALLDCDHNVMKTIDIGKNFMSGTVRARVRRGVLELLEKIDLPEGREVSITILDTITAKPADGSGMREALAATAGAWKGLINAEELKRNIYEDRLLNTRPTPEL